MKASSTLRHTLSQPTRNNNYVHASSAHPPGTGRGLIKGELLPYLRTNSHRETFETFREKHGRNTTNRGYSHKLFMQTTRSISFTGRPNALRNQTRKKNACSVFCTTYTPHIPPKRIQRLLNKHWHIIERSPHLSTIFPMKPKLAFTSHKSIKKKLVRARAAEKYEHHYLNGDLRCLQHPLPMPNTTPPTSVLMQEALMPNMPPLHNHPIRQKPQERYLT